jgi:PilZ domain
MNFFQTSPSRSAQAAVVDRRAYTRVQAPISVRPAGPVSVGRGLPRAVNDVSRGGLRAYSDDKHRIGERLELELFLPEPPSIVVVAEVVWVEKLPEGGPARFDVGMRYVEVRAADFARIAAFLPKEG